MTEYLFSYGTLQLKNVQIESFGRKLEGTKETLIGYKIEQLQIKDNSVISTSGKEIHPIAIKTNNNYDVIEGMLYNISKKELAAADAYEVDAYKRVKVVFQSKKEGWIYIKS